MTTSRTTVRDVTAGDVVAVRRVLVETWHDTYDRLIGAARVTELTDDWHAIEALERELARGSDHAFLLLAIGDDVVATGSASRSADTVVVHRLYVHPSRQGHGLGTVLLDALLARLGPAARVELNVMVGNARAQAFYERHGFAAHGQDEEHVWMQRAWPEPRR